MNLASVTCNPPPNTAAGRGRADKRWQVLFIIMAPSYVKEFLYEQETPMANGQQQEPDSFIKLVAKGKARYTVTAL